MQEIAERILRVHDQRDAQGRGQGLEGGAREARFRRGLDVPLGRQLQRRVRPARREPRILPRPAPLRGPEDLPELPEEGLARHRLRDVPDHAPAEGLGSAARPDAVPQHHDGVAGRARIGLEAAQDRVSVVDGGTAWFRVRPPTLPARDRLHHGGGDVREDEVGEVGSGRGRGTFGAPVRDHVVARQRQHAFDEGAA